MQKWVDAWKQRARQLKLELHALYLAYRDPRTPWYARAAAAVVVGYAFSPIDLIPDFIPLLGYLDDLLLLPLGILLVLKLIPAAVMVESRQKARELAENGQPVNRAAAAAIVCLWILLAGLGIWLAYYWLG